MAPNDWNSSRDDVMQSLGRIEARLDESLRAHTDAKKDFAEMQGRVTDLEKSKAWLLGAAAAVSAVIGFIAQHLPFAK